MDVKFVRKILELGDKLPFYSPALLGRISKKEYRFSERERRSIKLFLEALLFESPEESLENGKFQWFISEFEEHLAAMEGLPGLLMSLLPQIIERFPTLTISSPKNFSKLDFYRRQKVLTKVEKSGFPPLITAFVLAKTFAFAVLFDNPDMHRTIQFDGNCLSSEELDRRKGEDSPND